MLLIQVFVTIEHLWGSSSEIMQLCIWNYHLWTLEVPNAHLHNSSTCPPPWAGAVSILRSQRGQRKKIWRRSESEFVHLKSVIKCLLCNQTLCRWYVWEREDAAFNPGISEFAEKTGTHDYSKCVVEEQ